jgi:gamma-glutamyltranspeptidase/glutathione hydrolase
MKMPQRRSVVMAANGIVAAGHPLASTVGLDVLRNGGNAIDAAFTAAAVMGVVQPMMSGLGGDSFLLYYHKASRRLWAINGSGPAPRGLSLDYLRQHHNGKLPDRGMISVAVPGAVDVMCTAIQRWGSGRFDLKRILAPAIQYAEQGFPVAQTVAAAWTDSRAALAQFESTRRVFLQDGQAYQAGEWFRLPEYAGALRQIAEGGRDLFYREGLAIPLTAYSRAHGGLLDRDDLADYHCEVYEPLSVNYRGHTVFSTAPPSQGAILLEMLNLAEGFDLAALPWGGARAVHLLAEAKKLAFADRNAYLADPKFHKNPLSEILSKPYAAKRRQAIREDRAADAVAPGSLPEKLGDTTYLCVADREGNLVSLITSLSAAFGCAEVVPGTGILLNNRAGRGFTVDPASPNVVAPGKRTMHTLHCFMAFRDNEPLLVGGTPGGDAQPQSNFQLLTNIIDWGMNVQQAIDAPRWVSIPGTDPATLNLPLELRLEPGFSPETIAELERLGHRVKQVDPFLWFGAQMIMVDGKRGIYHGGSDFRVDGCAVGY